MNKPGKFFAFGIATALAVGIGTYAFTASSEESENDFGPRSMRMGHGMADHRMGHGMMGGGMMGGGMAGRGMMGMTRGDTARDMRTIHELAAEHRLIKRRVENLSDGIRTVTESDDPEVAALIKEHVAKMGERVRAGRMMGVPLESPAVQEIYRNKDQIRTAVEQTTGGVIVTQTSDDPKIAALLQQHAVEVSDLVRGGTQAMHAAMMRNMHGAGGERHGAMMPSMHGGMMHHGR